MKKIILLYISALLLICFPSSNVCFAESNPALTNNPTVLQNVIGRLMIEDIQKAVNDYYLEYLSSPPQIEVYPEKSSTKVLNISYSNNDNLYLVTIEVHPYVGAHITIGEDRVIFEISGSGNVKVREYKHIKSFEMPPWLSENFKKPFPIKTY